MARVQDEERRGSLYAEVTARVIAELEQGRLPWVQPWDSAACGCGMPENASSGRRYSGVNVLILWGAVIERGYSTQRWLTFRQALSLGGHVRRGEKGTIVCYADRFTPRGEEERARDEDREARQIAFLKRFTVFNVDQCDGLPEELTRASELPAERETIPHAEALIAATGADFRIGGSEAFYSPSTDHVQVPPQQAYGKQINWYRTALHELGHWTGHSSRLGRDFSGRFGSASYAREELVAELASAFVCASLSIQPTVRHADYLGVWLAVLREDEKAIFRAASLASKAADYLLAFAPNTDGEDA
ncbi:MAG TPA: zincin-like metallopeptidase domain-containing protein [Allosphingosinicella sp.]|nr:zincin-like metallopeptidase domain-containing protein [Allosphingosinicella sp.]